jgi:hypothetical protein
MVDTTVKNHTRESKDAPTPQVIAYLPDVDFGSRISALRAVGTSIGMTTANMPDQSCANSEMHSLKWINLYRAKVSLPLYTNLDYHDFTRALNDILLAGGGGAEITDPPLVTVMPVISGSLAHPAPLSCTTGTWTNSPTSYTYQWYRAGTAIAGATASTYTTAAADVGQILACNVTATNAAGSDNATSNSLGPIT